jgi:hypothetical protein
MQRQQLIVVHAGGEFQAVEVKVHPLRLAPMAHGIFAPRVVNQDAAHGVGRGCVKMRAVPPRNLMIAAETQPRLVNQSRGLQRLARIFARHFNRGELAQFVIDQRQQPGGRLGISPLDLLQHHREITHRKMNTGFRSVKEA